MLHLLPLAPQVVIRPAGNLKGEGYVTDTKVSASASASAGRSGAPCMLI